MVCQAEVLRVINNEANDHTPVITVIVPLEMADVVRGMRCLELESSTCSSGDEEDVEITLDDPDDTMVCRCEEITVGEIKRAIADGARTLTGVKRRTRAGMGLCQGRTCARLVERLLAEATGRTGAQVEPDTVRPPMIPVKMSVLGGTDGEP